MVRTKQNKGKDPRPSPYQLRTLSVPSPMFARFAWFVWFAGSAFLSFQLEKYFFLVGEVVFFGCVVSCSLYSLSSLILSCVFLCLMGESEESSGEIRGQRPHGRKRPPHAVWGWRHPLQATYLYQEVFFFRYWHKVSEQNDTTFRRCPSCLFGIA